VTLCLVWWTTFHAESTLRRKVGMLELSKRKNEA
jgi:hypothetical protein